MQKKIILFTAILFFLSSTWLFWVSSRTLDYDYQKNFWSLYFEKPKTDNLDFVIENHSDKADFHWEVVKGKEKIKEGDVKVEKGSSQRLSLEDLLKGFKDASGKIIIRVTTGEEKKDIYKNFDK